MNFDNHQEDTYLEFTVDTDDSRGVESQTRAMREGVPIPELAEQHHPNDSTSVLASRTALQTDRHSPSSCIDQPLAKRGTESRYRDFVLVRDDLSIQSSDGGHRRRGSFGLLDEDHTKCDKRSLADEIDAVLGHRLQDLHGVLKASTRAGNAKCEGRAASDMGVITLAEQLDNPWDLTGVLEEQEGKGSYSGAPNIVRGVRYGDVQ